MNRHGVHLGVVLALLVAVTPAASASRSAAPGRISGKLTSDGYTVLAVGANGKMTSTRALGGRFRLRPPGKVVALQLRGPNGKYAGPIVVSGRGKTVLVGVKAGVNLGGIRVGAARGYARVVKPVKTRWLAKSRWARARSGVPIGNGRNAGFVRSKPRSSPSGDIDADGVPDLLDVDINGNLILNAIEGGRSYGASRDAAPAFGEEQPGVYSDLNLALDETVNANASALSVADIDAAVVQHTHLGFGFPHDALTELDCGGRPDPGNPNGWIGGLSYCTRGGTGGASPSVATPAFPGAAGGIFDSDGDGFGTLDLALEAGCQGCAYFYVHPGATTARMGTGDIMIQRTTRDGVESQSPITLQFVFATVPALVSYQDTAGNSATVTYPVAAGAPGTARHGFPVAPGTDGHIVLTFSSWRPQRARIDGEPGSSLWVDMGRLEYAVPHIWKAALLPQQVGAAKGCPQSAYSTGDPNLTASGSAESGSFRDATSDQPSNAGNTFSYSLDVTQCLAAYGFSWASGEELEFHFWADTQGGKAEHDVFFTRQ